MLLTTDSMKTRILYPKNIWFNKKLMSLDIESRLVCLYLISNNNIGLTRTYKQHDLEIRFLFSLTEKKLNLIKEEIQKTELFYFYEEWVFINNDFSYCEYFGRDRVVTAKDKEIANIPTEVKDVFKGLKRGYKPTINHKPKTINHKPEEKKRKKYSSIDDLKEKDFVEISMKYNVTLSAVKDKCDDMRLWAGEKSGRGRGRNWRLTLMNWVKRDRKKGNIKETFSRDKLWDMVEKVK